MSKGTQMSEESPESSELKNCPMNRVITTFVKDFADYKKSQTDYQRDGRAAMGQVKEMYTAISRMQVDTSYLNQLPKIAKTNEEISVNFAALCQKVGIIEEGSFKAAIGRGQVPTSIFLIVVLVLCLVFLLRELADRDLTASPSSLQINHRASSADESKPRTP